MCPVEEVVEQLDTYDIIGDEEEYDAVRSFADSFGFYANTHQNYNPNLTKPGGGPWYLQRKKKFGGRLEREELDTPLRLRRDGDFLVEHLR